IAKLIDATNPVSKHIWPQFLPSMQKSLTDTSVKTSEKEALLLQKLNEILRGVSIYDLTRFQNVTLSPKTDWLRAQLSNLGREGLVRFNRLLLEDAYAQEIMRENASRGNRFGGRILDAGCGAGRDTRYFIERGFMVVSFDASEGM